jgi:hypothetical protein
MKLRELYASRLLMTGLLLIFLGIGNWIVGASQLVRYEGMESSSAVTGLEDSYRNFRELDRQKNEGVLRRINEDREKYNAVRVKIDFYYVVLSGGRLLFVVGLLLAFISAIRVIRRDTLAKVQKLAQPS